MMRNKKIFLGVFVAVILGFGSSFLISKYIFNKLHKEAQFYSNSKYYIQHLTDLHIMCKLDYAINPNGKLIYEECKELEHKLVFVLQNIEENTKYYSFYSKYFTFSKE